MNCYDLLKSLNISDQELSSFKNSAIGDPVYKASENKLEIKLETYQILPYRQYQHLITQLSCFFNCEIVVLIDAENTLFEFADVKDYINDIVQKHQLRKIISHASYTVTDSNITFKALNEGEYDYIQGVLEVLSSELKQFGFTGVCLCEMDTLVEIEPVFTQMNPVNNEKPKEVTTFSYMKKSLKDYTKVTINMLQNEEILQVYFEAQLFKIDSRETSNGNTLSTLYFTDFDDAIETTVYQKPEDLELEVGQWAEVYGDYVFDNYRKQNSFKHKQSIPIKPLVNYYDNAPEKRIELHAHTKFSEMDGVADVGELITQAYHFNHPAIAITDHGGVHSFPKAQSIANNLNKKDPDHQIKVIYGLEMNVVSDEIEIVQANSAFNLQEQTYVIFDLETTGLSSQYDHIIEFGAIKVVNQSNVDRIQMFIKPPIPIPERITQITQITDEDVKDAKTLQEALPEILDFIGDAVLVAHNGMFDYRFLMEATQKCHLPRLRNGLIDTLALSWGLLENRKSYALGSVARYYKIAYDQNIAHRADYDAQVLQSVFMSMLSELLSKNITTSDELIEFQKSINPIDKARPYHVTLLAKNQKGLKDLYRLVSLSHTDYLMYRGKSTKKEDESLAEPRITRELINQSRDDLLVGSACFNSYLFELARVGNQDELEEEMQFYDYIELQPLHHYDPLLYKNSILSEEHLISILKNIFLTAHKLNKCVVATGDVHYVLKHEKVFREIYINAMGIGGAKHPLYIYDEQLRAQQLSPDQHLMSTQEMLEGYPYLSKAEVKRIVIENSHKINNMIDTIQPVPKELYTPTIEGSDQKLTDLVYENAYALYGNPLPEIVKQRIEKELHSIISNGFGVIYYTSHLLVKQSLDDGYMVGSRGSVGSSLVATLAHITEVNPLVPHYVCPHCHHSEFFTQNEYASGYDLPDKACPQCSEMMITEGQDIPFETFLGFEGDKVPDIDLNFSSDYQEKAHAYTKDIFGEDKVLRAGTIGTIADKTAYGFISGYFESVPPKQTKHNAYREYLISGATGVKRSTGQHPGGIVVIPQDKEILDFTPYQYPANNPEAAWKTTHYEYHDIGDNILKLDILGHVDPTAMRFLEDVSGLKVTDIPLNDPLTMSIFSSTDALMLDPRRQRDSNGAVGLPEFGTQFVRKMLQDTNPKKFSDLVRISGLSHGTDVWLKNAQAIIQNGYTLDDVIACRDDIMTYLSHIGLEEKTAFNIMESVRKGKGLKPEWIVDMQNHGVSDWYIQSAQMIKYLFPKAHAVAYCIMGFRVAWFKVHRPLDFYAQFFTLRCNAYEVSTMMEGADAIEKRLNDIIRRRALNSLEDKVTAKEEQLINTLEVAFEMYIRGYRFKPVDIMESRATEFWPDPKDPKALLIPFNAVDNLGDGVARNIVKERESLEFLSIEDFKKRTQINQSALEQLKKLKALDHLSELNQLSFF